MFSRGWFNPGVIIDPNPEFAFDLEDQEKLTEFRDRVWWVAFESVWLMSPLIGPTSYNGSNRSTVERMNEFAPQHSGLFKEVCYSSSCPFVRSGTLILFLWTFGIDDLGLVSGKPFTHAAKLTARRQAIIVGYELEIDALYNAVDETAQGQGLS